MSHQAASASAEAAQRLLGETLHPRLLRALFGIDELADSFDRDALAPDFDLKPIRKAVADLIESLRKHQPLTDAPTPVPDRTK